MSSCAFECRVPAPDAVAKVVPSVDNVTQLLGLCARHHDHQGQVKDGMFYPSMPWRFTCKDRPVAVLSSDFILYS